MKINNIYLIRLWNIVKIILEIVGTIIFGILFLCFSIAFGGIWFLLSPLAISLSIIEFATVVPVYYVLTGYYYYEKYHSIIEMYGDVFNLDPIRFRK